MQIPKSIMITIMLSMLYMGGSAVMIYMQGEIISMLRNEVAAQNHRLAESRSKPLSLVDEFNPEAVGE